MKKAIELLIRERRHWGMLLIIAIGLLLTAVACGEPESSKNASKAMTKETILHQKSTDHRPNYPLDEMECRYGDGIIGFVFPEKIDALNVRIYDETYEWRGRATRQEPVIEIPSLKGRYQITCSSDNGLYIFEGELDF